MNLNSFSTMPHFNFRSLKTNLEKFRFLVSLKFSLTNYELFCEIQVCCSMASENISISKYQRSMTRKIGLRTERIERSRIPHGPWRLSRKIQ